MLELWEEYDYLGELQHIVTSDNSGGDLATEPGDTCRVWVGRDFV